MKRARVWGFTVLLGMALAASIPPSAGLSPPQRFEKIVFVTYDGVSVRSIEQAMSEGSAPVLSALGQQGGQILLRIIGHVTKTDPGLAAMETGYGPSVTGILANYFGESAVAEKRVIPDGLTIAERLKERYGPTWKTGFVISWLAHWSRDTKAGQSIFWNMAPEIDFWWSSANITWSRSNQTLVENALAFENRLLRAPFTARPAAEFVHRFAKFPFYLRVHFTDPDFVGHGSGDHTSAGDLTNEYRSALKSTDQGLGIIVQALKDEGVLAQTLLLISTDHGFAGGHGGPGHPFEDPEISTTWLISSSKSVIQNPLGWGLQEDVAPTILAVAGIEVGSLKPEYATTSKALPLYQVTPAAREEVPPQILAVIPRFPLGPGEPFSVLVRVADASGIREVRLFYQVEGIAQWRFVAMEPVNATAWSGVVRALLGGRETAWYVAAVDNAVGLNVARYPVGDRVERFLTPTQEKLAEEAPDTAAPYYGGIVVALVIALAIAVAARKRHVAVRKSAQVATLYSESRNGSVR